MPIVRIIHEFTPLSGNWDLLGAPSPSLSVEQKKVFGPLHWRTVDPKKRSQALPDWFCPCYQSTPGLYSEKLLSLFFQQRKDSRPFAETFYWTFLPSLAIHFPSSNPKRLLIENWRMRTQKSVSATFEVWCDPPRRPTSELCCRITLAKICGNTLRRPT